MFSKGKVYCSQGKKNKLAGFSRLKIIILCSQNQNSPPQVSQTRKGRLSILKDKKPKHDWSFSSPLGPGCIFTWSSIHSLGSTQIVCSIKIKYQLTFNTTQLWAITRNGMPAPPLLNHKILLPFFSQANDPAAAEGVSSVDSARSKLNTLKQNNQSVQQAYPLENYMTIQLLNVTGETGIKFMRKGGTYILVDMHHYSTGRNVFCFSGIQLSMTWSWSSPLSAVKKNIPCRHFKNKRTPSRILMKSIYLNI